MSINDYLPVWDVRSRHQIRVDAAPGRTYAAIRTADLAASPIVRGLLALRALPGALLSGELRRLAGHARQPFTLERFEQRGFAVLTDAPPAELILGLEGSFWRPSGDLRPVTRKSFGDPVPAGVARAAWSFTVVPLGAAESMLLTETRVLTGDAAARRRFLVYWTAVGWGSGLIRRFMLRTIKLEAERRERGSTP